MNNKILNLDFSKNSTMQPIIYGRVGDQGLQTVTVNIFRNGAPVDLSVGVLSFEGVTSRNQTKVFDSYNINSTEEGLKKGTFEYTFPSEAFAVTGKYERAYFSITSGDSRDTTADFEIIVFGNADINASEAETVITEYNKLIEELQKLQNEYIEETDTTFASIQGRITNLENTIESYKNDVSNTQTEVLATIDEALKKFQSSDFYTKTEADENFATQVSLENGALVFKNTYISSQDWNDIQDVGIYYCAGSSGKNMPTSGPLYGYLTVKKITTVTQQTFETGLSVYIRSLTGNPQTWSNWHEIALTEKTVNLSEDQEVDGTKNFLKQPLFNGKSLAQEVFGVTLHGGKLEGVPVKDGTTLNWGEPYSYDNERSKNNDLFTVSDDTKTLTILKDCTLQFIGKFTCQTNHADYYAYLGMRVNGEDDWRAAGIGGNLNWRNDVGWIMVREFKTGEEVTLVTGTNYSTDSVNAWGVDQVYIKEVIRA